MQSGPRRQKMSVSSHYYSVCCPYCVNPSRWCKRGSFQKNSKKITLRTHRRGNYPHNRRNFPTVLFCPRIFKPNFLSFLIACLAIFCYAFDNMNKKNIFYWALYGFAKDIVIVTFALYFSQWLVVQNGVADIWYNMIFVGASALLIFSAPVLAIAADKRGQAMPYLRLAAILLFIVILSSGLFAVLSDSHKSFVILAAWFFLLAEYFYQFSLIFHNALLTKISNSNKQGLISGIGYTANWFGQIAGILIALPIASGAIYFFGQHGRAQTFVPATIIFFILALPMLLFFREPKADNAIKINYRQEFRNLKQSFTHIMKLPGVGRFLLAFFFYNDAILTMENNFAIYMQRVFNASDAAKSLLLLGVLIATAVGALASGWFADKFGLKKSLIWTLVFLVIIFSSIGFAPSYKIFADFAVILGIFYGASLTVARALLAHFAPREEANHIFSYYSIFERFATFVGPVSWGLVLLLLSRYGVWNYKIAVLTMGLFVFIGLVIFVKVPDDKPAL